jgi:hypothetical protein
LVLQALQLNQKDLSKPVVDVKQVVRKLPMLLQPR